MIKTQVITETEKVLYFPILMESIKTDRIVLFISEVTGMTVSGSEELGYYSESWVDASNAEHWKVFKGELKLSND